MFAEYVKQGENLNYVNPTDEVIHPGAVIVLGSIIGIAACRMEPGELGSVATTGVWRMATGNESVSMGDRLYYNPASDTVTASGTDSNSNDGTATESGADSGAVYVGFAAEDSGAGNDIVMVALNR